jgi:hypothetical protein
MGLDSAVFIYEPPDRDIIPTRLLGSSLKLGGE